MDRVMIVGGMGNMGRRYKIILENVLKKDTEIFDRDVGDFAEDIKKCDGAIIATPTSQHLFWIRELAKYGIPVLCEKPLAFSVAQLDELENKNRLSLGQLTMVNQYEYLINSNFHGDTFYDYFKTGDDGLLWDCINIIGLSEKKPIYIDNMSPVWNCMINGQKLSIDKMDSAYISMLRAWTNEPKSNYAYARRAHQKVENMIKGKW